MYINFLWQTLSHPISHLLIKTASWHRKSRSHYLHFTPWEIEAQRDNISCPGHTIILMAGWVSKTGTQTLEPKLWTSVTSLLFNITLRKIKEKDTSWANKNNINCRNNINLPAKKTHRTMEMKSYKKRYKDCYML